MTSAADRVGAGLQPARAARPVRAAERIHVVGAAGAGASAAAILGLHAGAVVSGCDPGGPSPYTPALGALGIVVAPEHAAAHVTVVAHSYGSVVLGQAMKAGLDAPTAVAVGSPGMDADDRSELGSRATTLWAAKSTTALAVHLVPFFGVPWFDLRIGDPVAFAPVHGEDPSAKGFGARRFPVGDISGHGEYFDPGTVSVRNIARIAISRRPE